MLQIIMQSILFIAIFWCIFLPILGLVISFSSDGDKETSPKVKDEDPSRSEEEDDEEDEDEEDDEEDDDEDEEDEDEVRYVFIKDQPKETHNTDSGKYVIQYRGSSGGWIDGPGSGSEYLAEQMFTRFLSNDMAFRRATRARLVKKDSRGVVLSVLSS